MVIAAHGRDCISLTLPIMLSMHWQPPKIASTLLCAELHTDHLESELGRRRTSKKDKMLHLLICKGVPAICKQVARHDGAAVADAALVQLRELQGWRGQWLEGTLYLGTRQEGLHMASRSH